MNVELLQKVKAHILEEPMRFQMGQWIRTGEPGEKIRLDYDTDRQRTRAIPSCGTVACLAGWACELGGQHNHLYTEGTARDLLGLDTEQSWQLFRLHEWPADLRHEWRKTRSVRKHAQIAARMIDRFIRKWKEKP